MTNLRLPSHTVSKHALSLNESIIQTNNLHKLFDYYYLSKSSEMCILKAKEINKDAENPTRYV